MPATTAAPEAHDTSTSTDAVSAVGYEADATTSWEGAGAGDDTTTGSVEGTTIGGVGDTSTGAPEEVASAAEAAHEAQPAAVAVASGDSAEPAVIVADGHARQTSRASSLDPRDAPPGGVSVWLLWLRSAAFVLALGLVLFITWPVISHRLHDQKVRVRERGTREAVLRAIQDEEEEAMRNAEEGARRAAEEEAVFCARAAAERRAREEAMRLARQEAERMARGAAELQARD